MSDARGRRYGVCPECGGVTAAEFDESSDVPLTRIEVLDFVGDAFGDQPVDRATLIATAEEAGAREELLERLRTVPDGAVADPADLWAHLPDVPEDLQHL